MLPGVWGSEHWQKPNLELEDLPTRFGPITVNCQTLGKIIQLTYRSAYRICPSKVRLRLGGRYRVVAADCDWIENESYVDLEPNFSYLRLERDRFESLS